VRIAAGTFKSMTGLSETYAARGGIRGVRLRRGSIGVPSRVNVEAYATR
jgi:hypothetical protein